MTIEKDNFSRVQRHATNYMTLKTLCEKLRKGKIDLAEVNDHIDMMCDYEKCLLMVLHEIEKKENNRELEIPSFMR